MIKVATAFSGGLAACEWAMKYEDIPHEVVYACEWDKYARKQYLEFHGEPTCNFYEDIQDLDATPYRDKIDLFVFGSPCQDLSLAGKRKGFLGEKSSLFRHGARVLEEMKPKIFIFENVKGLLSSNKGADYKEVIDTFQELGYLIASNVVNAKECGTAQNRERVFIVGFLNEEEYHSFHFAEPIPLTKRLKDYLDDEVEEKYYLSEKLLTGFISKEKRYEEENKSSSFLFKPQNKDGVCSTITSRIHKCSASDPYIQEVQKIGYVNQDTQASAVFDADGLSPTLCSGTHGYAQGYVKEPALKQAGMLDIKGADSTKRVYDVDGICPTMTTMGGGNRQPKVLMPTLEVGDEDISNPLKGKTPFGWHFEQKVYSQDSRCTRALTSSEGSGSREKVIQDFRIRRLTPRECFRLMGVKDEDIYLVNSDTQSYKIAGNGIEVETIRSIIRQLYKPAKAKNTLF